MAVTIANTTYSGELDPSSTSGVSSVSTVHASGEGFLVGIRYQRSFAAPNSISSVVWDSGGDNQTLTLIGSVQQPPSMDWRLAVYYLAAPTSAKTGNVTVTFSAANNNLCAILVRHITGHDTSTMIRGNASFTGGFGNTLPRTISDSISSATGDLVVDFLLHRAYSGTASATSPQADATVNPSAATGYLASSSKAGATSVSMGWSETDDADFAYAHTLVSIQPSGGGSSGHFARFRDNISGGMSGMTGGMRG